MPEFQFIVEPYLSGVRVDSFLARHLRNYTRWRLHRLVSEGLVTIDDHRVAEDQRVHRGQTVAVRLLEPPDKLLPPADNDVQITYEDPWLMVVDKPAGLITHPVGDFYDGSLTNTLQRHLDEQTTARGLLRPGIVHRLDRMTSGLLVVPKDHMSHRLLSVDFQKGRPKKRYVALVEGNPSYEQLAIDLPIGQRSKGNSVLMSAASDAIRPRHARTDVRVVDRLNGYSLVECDLHTGRNHQIRIHMAQIGHPVLGDEFYGANGVLRQAPRLTGAGPTDKRHALHACSLQFQHPILQTPMTFESAPPDDFWRLAEEFAS